MSPATPMETYEALVSLSSEMLLAARNADWARLVNLEQASRRLVDQLSADPDWMPAAAEHRKRRQQIIRRILSDDAEIRDLVQPWMAQARQFLTSLKLERQMRQSYQRLGFD